MADSYAFDDLFAGEKEDMEFDSLVDLLQLDSNGDIMPPRDPDREHEAASNIGMELLAGSPDAHPSHGASSFDAVAVKSEDLELASEQDEDGKQRRRRRSRNSKQQELNRLAQQRYRERKKQKYTDMQQSVDALACQLGQLSTLQKENRLLRGRAQELEVTIQKKDLQVKQHQEQLKTTHQILTKQVNTIREQQATIGQQGKRVQEQAAQAQEMQHKLDNTLDAALLSLDADTVSSKVVAAVKSAMTSSKEFKSLHPTLAQMPDAVVQQISSTLTRCCAEMYLQLKQSARSEPPAAIQVPCC